MAETDTIEADGDAVRVPLSQRPAREAPRDGKDAGPAVTVTAEDAPAAIDPEAHVAEITRSLQGVTSERDAANQRATIAEQGRQRAERIAAEAVTRVKSAEHIAAGSAVETATAQLAAAKQKLKVARDSGDTNAEADALGEIGAAGAMEATAKAELQRFAAGDPASAAGRMTEPGAQPRQQTQPRQAQGEQPISNRTQAWIAAHPKFNTDANYKAAMLSEHYRLEGTGIKENTNPEQYYAALDAHAARLEGVGGDANGDRMTDTTRRQPAARPNGFQGASPDRNSGVSGNTKTYKTPISPLTVTTRADGTKTIKVPPEAVPDYKEFAEVNGMKYDEYVQSLVNIEEEKAEGRYPGAVTTDGGIYR